MDRARLWFKTKVLPPLRPCSTDMLTLRPGPLGAALRSLLRLATLACPGRGARQELRNIRRRTQAIGALCSCGMVLRPLPTPRCHAELGILILQHFCLCSTISLHVMST